MRHLAILATVISPAICLATEPFPKEAELLKDVKVAEGLEATLFSAPPQSNYPVFVAAAADGTLYVSSDANGSLDRELGRGRILRLRDTDGDGRADEVKEFAKVDAPRGLLWDGDRVICMHPPNLSAFIDKDGDGVADEEKVLVKGLAFDLKGRPADHTTNGIEMGVDGWIYIAGGDFGFMEAEGTDGRKVQLRGGGVLRVRPDGSNLQIYSRGTRNILEAAVSPQLDIFARDNTNDGGGWDLKFHHFTGFEDHGYPRLFKNFSDETVHWLADYGGGAGCGAFWLDEPGWPAAWNNHPYTSDWGRNPVYRHDVKPKGATFEETAPPTEFVKVTRATDGDVDALGHVYVSSWRGASYTYAGPNVGYIIRVQPKGHQAPALPDFAKASDTDLVKLLESPSSRTRLEAQRTLLRRGKIKAVSQQLLALAKDTSKPVATRIVALYTLQQATDLDGSKDLATLAADPTIAPWALRAWGERNEGKAPDAKIAIAALKSNDARTRKEAIIALARIQGLTGIWADGGTPTPQKITPNAQSAAAIAQLLGDADPIVAHTAMQVLRELSATDTVLPLLDNPALRNGALMVLRGIHDTKTVDAVIAHLNSKKDSGELRQGLLTALCRLYYTEANWTATSWGTRPDTRGPVYDTAEWSETKKIADTLKAALASANGEESAFLAKEFVRHRIKMDDASAKLIALAEKDPSSVSLVIQQLATSEAIPANALPVLTKAATDPATKEEFFTPLGACLAKMNDPQALNALLEVMARAKSDSLKRLRESLFGTPLIENYHQVLEAAAEKADGRKALWADAALLQIASRKVGAPEPREMAAKALNSGWEIPKRRAQIIRAAAESNDKSRAVQIAAALSDSDPDVAKAAQEAVKKLQLDPAKLAAEAKPAGPLIATLKVEDVLNQVMNVKGDVAKGEQLFTQQGCVACHTVKASEPPKGPFLGNIATLYKRRELAENILLPNKSLAQGFVTNQFTMKDGSVQMGFVTQEAADKVVIRTIAAQEVTIDPNNVVKREKLEKSLMPEGLVGGLSVQDFGSLLAYLEALAGNK